MAQTMNISKPTSAKKSVKFAVNEGNNDHFTKPTYFGQINPPINQNNANAGIRRSQSVPELPNMEGGKNVIPTRAPSNSGFKPSFLTSGPPDSAKEEHRYHEQVPASMPSGYSDKSRLGASAAKITELLKRNDEAAHNPFNNLDGDVRVQRSDSSSSKKRVKFLDNLEENKSLHIEGENDIIQSSRREKQTELQRILEKQIQEKSERQRREDELRRKQDELEEERIRKELEEDNRRYQMEMEAERQKAEEAKRANEQIMMDKQKRDSEPPVRK
mmetsp:Transcript_24126/g.24048  ORF Transcript_24126/g.24048 Transcript_24126/m.24048 type:complete len:273 (+) Transcript_24126:121-939(+)